MSPARAAVSFPSPAPQQQTSSSRTPSILSLPNTQSTKRPSPTLPAHSRSHHRPAQHNPPPALATYTPSALTLLCLLQIFSQSLIEGFSFTYLGIFTGFITGTVIIVAYRLLSLSPTPSLPSSPPTPRPPYDAFFVILGFILGSFLSGQHALLHLTAAADLSQMRTYQLSQLAAALFLVATALSVAFLQVDPNDLETPASYSISVLLSIWSGFSFSAIKLLQVPDLPLPICTGAVNSLFNERFRHDGEGWAASCKRVALVLVIFAGALVGAAGARAGGGVSGSGRGRGMEWVVLVVALFVTVVCLGVAEGIERRRKRKERRGGGGEPLSESTAVAVEK